MPIYKCEKCGKVHRTEDAECVREVQPESKPCGISADGAGSLSCASDANTGNEVNRLKVTRISRGMTQKQLADALGLKYPEPYSQDELHDAYSLLRDLERRCRNAEKLLDECNLILAANGLYPSTQKRVSAHLAAAAQEDGK